jgi:hypothetical protein
LKYVRPTTHTARKNPKAGAVKVQAESLSASFSRRSSFVSFALSTRAVEIIAEIAERGEPDATRYLAAKYLIERGYGLPEGIESQAGPTVVNVLTGVRGADRPGEPGYDPPPSRPLLPDGRDPFEQSATAPSGSRPTGRAPVSDPPQHRLFEGEPETSSATVQREK